MEAIEIIQEDLGIEETIKKYQNDRMHSKYLNVKFPEETAVIKVNRLEDVSEYINDKYSMVNLPIETFVARTFDNVIRTVKINDTEYTKYINLNLQPFGEIYFVEKIKE